MAKSELLERFQESITHILSRSNNVSVFPYQSLGVTIGSTLGHVRGENQDRVLFLRVRLENPKRHFSAAVICDGMGGLEEGGQCATLAISVFASSLISSQQNDFQKKLIEAVNDANKAVYKQFLGNGGTTLSAIIFDENFNCWGANVGDSRIYTSFPNKRIKQLSFDDTIQAELLNLNRPINNSRPDFRRLFQYVGVGKDLDISSERNVFRIDVKKEFKYLILTSDGIHNIPSETLESLVINAESSYELTYRLITHAEWTGGLDNASIVVIPNQVVSTSHIDDEVVAGGIAFLTLQGWISILPPAIIKNLVDDDETVNRSQFRKSRRGTTKPSPISTSTKSRDVLERKSESTSIVSSYENMPGEPMNPLVGIDSSVSRTSKDERQKLSSEKEAGDSRRQKQDEFSEQSSADGEQSKVAPEPLQLDIGNELNEASQLDNQKAFNSSGKAFPEELIEKERKSQKESSAEVSRQTGEPEAEIKQQLHIENIAEN